MTGYCRLELAADGRAVIEGKEGGKGQRSAESKSAELFFLVDRGIFLGKSELSNQLVRDRRKSSRQYL